ncbi:MAG: GntR family transcriptional regulator [Reyranella sp.]|nr:GntR family transcriptional regulator [Reyranella sp.]
MFELIVHLHFAEERVNSPTAARAWEGSVFAYRLLGDCAPLTLTLPEQIAAGIGERIFADVYAPGARIVEQDLAQEFATSRGPVREALRILEREGLVRIHARRGAQVTLLTEQEVRDVFEVRAALLRIVSERLVQSRSLAAISLLENGVTDLERYAADPASGRLYADTTFRLALSAVRLVGNATLTNVLTSLSLQTLRYTRLGLASAARRKQSLKLWREALAAMKAGDAKRAGDLVVERVERSRDEVVRQLAVAASPRIAAA